MQTPHSLDKSSTTYQNPSNPVVSFSYPDSPTCSNPPQVVYCPTIIQYPPVPRYQKAYSGCIASFSVVLGVFQIIAGCVSSGAGSLCFVYSAENYEYGAGFWSGAMFVVSGCVAISAGKRRTDYLINVQTLVCPATTIFAVALFGVSLDGVLYDRDYDNNDWVSGYYRDYAIVGNSILIAVASFEILISTIMFLMCVHVVCCASKATQVVTHGCTNYTMPSYQHCQPMYGQQQILVAGRPTYVSVPNHAPPSYSALAVPQGILGSPVPFEEKTTH